MHKAADRRETAVSGSGRVAAVRFHMIQKAEHGIALDVIEGQFRYGLVFLVSQKHVEEFQSVPVSTHGVGTCAACVLQIRVKEAFRQAQEGCGRRPAHVLSVSALAFLYRRCSRLPARSSSSGVELR